MKECWGMYGNQGVSGTMWDSHPTIPPSPDRQTANLGQPLRQLRGEPTPLALSVLFANVHGKQRHELAREYFGNGKRGPRKK